MREGFITRLPLEITIDILSRLPLRTIISCKCVCKSWLELLESNEFVQSHLSQSAPGIAIYVADGSSEKYRIFEFEDGESLEHHDLHYIPLTNFDIPCGAQIKGYANGLLFLLKLSDKFEGHYVCNPITREYIEVHCPEEFVGSYPQEEQYPERKFIQGSYVYTYPQSITYGFGAGKVTGQHKVVRIFHDSVIVREGQGDRRIIPDPECHVYTLGTRSWRRVAPGAPLEYSVRISSVFLNGNLHWVVSDSESKLWISCFDVETEKFSTLSAPPVHYQSFQRIGGFSALGDCLCLCDQTRENKTVIWLMKEYGVEKSWTKEYVIDIDGYFEIDCFELVYPIKVFEDGDILILWEDSMLFYYSQKTLTVELVLNFNAEVNSILFTPSFLSLKTLGVENVISF